MYAEYRHTHKFFIFHYYIHIYLNAHITGHGADKRAAYTSIEINLLAY